MEFTASQITQITGVKRTRLQQWLEKGYLSPSIQQASGHGTRNIYSIVDVYSIAIFKKIIESGLSRKVVADMLEKSFIDFAADEAGVNDIEHIVYIRKGDHTEALAICVPEIKLDLLSTNNLMKNYDDAYIINFRKIKQETDKRIHEHN